MLKNYTELEELKENNPDSDGVFAPSLVDVHYPSKLNELEDLCLYDFVKYVDWYHRDKDGKKTYRRLAKPRVPNHPTYDPRKLEQVDATFNLSFCCLFHLEMKVTSCSQMRLQSRHLTDTMARVYWATMKSS